MNNISDHDRGYIEGIIDGEGTVTLRKLTHIKREHRYKRGYQWNPQVYVSNTNMRLLEKLKSIIGDGSIVSHNVYKPELNFKPSFKYNFTRNTIRELLPKLDLVIKSRQKELVIEALRYVGHNGKWTIDDETDKRLHEILLEIRSLNKRGQTHVWDNESKLEISQGSEPRKILFPKNKAMIRAGFLELGAESQSTVSANITRRGRAGSDNALKLSETSRLHSPYYWDIPRREK